MGRKKRVRKARSAKRRARNALVLAGVGPPEGVLLSSFLQAVVSRWIDAQLGGHPFGSSDFAAAWKVAAASASSYRAWRRQDKNREA